MASADPTQWAKQPQSRWHPAHKCVRQAKLDGALRGADREFRICQEGCKFQNKTFTNRKYFGPVQRLVALPRDIFAKMKGSGCGGGVFEAELDGFAPLPVVDVEPSGQVKAGAGMGEQRMAHGGVGGAKGDGIAAARAGI